MATIMSWKFALLTAAANRSAHRLSINAFCVATGSCKGGDITILKFSSMILIGELLILLTHSFCAASALQMCDLNWLAKPSSASLSSKDSKVSRAHRNSRPTVTPPKIVSKSTDSMREAQSASGVSSSFLPPPDALDLFAEEPAPPLIRLAARFPLFNGVL